MPSPFHSTKKEFILHSQGEDSYVEVTPSHTLFDVRRLILEEFDTEQLPCKQNQKNAGDDGTCESTNEADVEFAFRVNGIRISAKQEVRKNAFDLLARGVKVELVPKKIVVQKRSKAEDEEGESADLSVRRSAKRVKMGGAGAVTPFEPEIEGGLIEESNLDKGAEEEEEVQNGDDDVIAPVQLDDKFASSANSKNNDENSVQKEILGGRDKEDQGERDIENDESKSIEDSVEKDSMDLELEGEKMLAKKNDSMNDVLAELEDSNTSGKKKAADDNMAEDLGTTLGGQTKAADDILDDIDNLETSTTKNKTDDSNDDILEVTNDNDEGENTIANINPHKVSDEAKEKSRHVLNQLANILKNNPNFCSDVRTKEWLDDIKSLTEKSSPQTVFGVLGNTGVGKSSLLNGLLDEAAVLPTSGSRGCTAAVVELVFHSELLEKAKHDNHDVNASADEPATVPVYRGEVEFLKLEDWRKELKTLVDECSTQEKTIYALPPKEDAMPDAAASWQKIEQVYGRRSMDQYCKKSTDYVYHQLAHNMRVKNLLTATTPGQDYNSIIVQAGEVVPGSEDAQELIKGHGQMKSKMKGKKKKWAQEFRKQINSYVYRMGNGDQPQTWPLIRKVELRGPWSVLSTGAVLVDLPGVRDSNAARAKVAESYLQNCNQIAIVAPIKRAVDDGTAKELLGEQFKRRLLMDGQYGNVFFICTQTDDIEATETMRDHADVAQEVPGRWERMNELSQGISGFESQLYPLSQQEEDLEGQVEDAKQQLKDSLEDLKQAEKEANDDYSDDEDNSSLLEDLKGVIDESKAAFVKAKEDLASWRDEHSPAIESIQGKCDRLQKKLKAMCSAVRNEYSKNCLQEDFKSGLKELYRKDDDDSGSDGNDAQTALPEDFNMEVFCISANDYLKLMKIKPSRDGPPSCFANASDTQIPIMLNEQVCSRVH